jgi:hypothetical protein
MYILTMETSSSSLITTKTMPSINKYWQQIMNSAITKFHLLRNYRTNIHARTAPFDIVKKFYSISLSLTWILPNLPSSLGLGYEITNPFMLSLEIKID